MTCLNSVCTLVTHIQFHCQCSLFQNRHRSDNQVNNRKVEVLIDRKWVCLLQRCHRGEILPRVHRSTFSFPKNVNFPKERCPSSVHFDFVTTKPCEKKQNNSESCHTLAHIYNMWGISFQNKAFTPSCSCFLHWWLVYSLNGSKYKNTQQRFPEKCSSINKEWNFWATSTLV